MDESSDSNDRVLDALQRRRVGGDVGGVKRAAPDTLVEAQHAAAVLAAAGLRDDDASDSQQTSAALAMAERLDIATVGALTAAEYVSQRAEYVTREIRAAAAGNFAYTSELPRRATLSVNVFDHHLLLRALRVHQLQQQQPAAAAAATTDEVPAAALRSAVQRLVTAYYAQQPSRRAHEEMMLRTPADNEPACAAGDACRGHQIECEGGGARLVAYYSEHVWAEYVRRADLVRRAALEAPGAAVEEARLPEQSALCLLCIRVAARQYYLQCAMADDSGGGMATVAAAAAQQQPVISASPIYNLVDIDGEYRHEDCFGPSNRFVSGLVRPLVRPDLLSFRRRVAGHIVYFQQLLPVYSTAAAAAAEPLSEKRNF